MNATTGTAGRVATPAGNGGETAPPALRRQTMQAIVQDAYGAADVWRVEEIALPEIAGNEVLVKVHAAGLDRGTWHLMAGQPYLMRLMGYGLRTPKNRVPGLDVAGSVVAAGAQVTRFAAGDGSSASARVPSPSTRAPARTSSRASRRTLPSVRPRPSRSPA